MRYLPHALFLIIFGFYGMTLYPGVPGGDSGELINAAYNLVVAHPPGYPLLTMLGHISSYMPVGSIAWRMNLLSALLSSLAALFLFLALRRETKNDWASALAVGLFSFSHLVWEYSVSFEVFSLNNLLLALMIYFLSRHRESEHKQWVYAAAFTAGLGISNQHSIALFVLPCGLWWLWSFRKQFLNPKELGKVLGISVLGLLPYVYIPIASINADSFTWGDQSSLQGFLDHFLRREYGTFSLAIPGQEVMSFFEVVWKYLTALFRNGLVVFPILGFWGMKLTMNQKKKSPLAVGLGLSFFVYLLVFLSVAKIPEESLLFRGVFERFFQQPNLLFSFFVALGLAKLFHKANWKESWAKGLLALALAVQIFMNFPRNQQQGGSILTQDSENILKSLPPGAIYIGQGDHSTFPLFYTHFSKGIRPDVRLVAFSTIQKDWAKKVYKPVYPELKLSKNFVAFFKLNQDRPLFSRSFTLPADHPEILEDFDIYPYGVGVMISPKGSTDFSQVYEKAYEALPVHAKSERLLESVHGGSWQYQSLLTYWESHFQYARHLVIEGRSSSSLKATYLDRAIEMLTDFTQNFPEDVPADVYLYLGEAYMHSRGRVPQANEKMLKNFKNYLKKADTTDPNYQNISRLVEKTGLGG